MKASFKKFALVLGALLILLPGASLRAQTNNGTVRGSVTDPSGAAVPGATIQLVPASGQPVTTTSGPNGAYEVRGLGAGKYTLKVAAPGFDTFENDDVELTQGQLRSIDVPLVIQVQQQKVEVTATAGGSGALDVSPENNAGAVVLRGADLDALSDDPDQLQADLTALAGPSIGPEGGQMYIDGFTAGQLPPKSSIREIRINQNPFSAEYDRLGFGRIEILTKPGTDSLHGSFFVMGNDKAFNSLNPYIGTDPLGNPVPVPGYYTVQYNGNIGGALGKKASYFFSAQRRNINEVELGSTVDPSTFLVNNNGFAIANPRTRTELGPRLDYQLTPSNTLTVRYQYERNSETNDGISEFTLASQANNEFSEEHTVQITDSQIISPNVVNESRFQFLRDYSTITVQSLAPQISVPTYLVAGGSSQGNGADTQDHYEFQNYTTIAHGRHAIKFGVRLRDVTENSISSGGSNGSFSFASGCDYQWAELGSEPVACTLPGVKPVPTAIPLKFQITCSTSSCSGTLPPTNINLLDAGLYVQDDYKWRPNVTLSAGLRFEAQQGIPDHGDFAPRFAIAWGIGKTKTGSPKVVLRGGWGMFYSRFTQALLLNATRLNGTTQTTYTVSNPPFFPTVPTLTQLQNTYAATSSPSKYEIASNLRAPYIMETALTLEKQLTRNTTVTVNYLNARGVHQFYVDDINPITNWNPALGTGGACATNPCTRPTSYNGDIYQYTSGGIFRQNQLTANFNIRATTRISLNGYYSLNFASGTTGNTISDPGNPALDYGRTQFDVRHRVFFGGNVNLKYGFSLSPFMIASSGSPYNITAGKDLFGTALTNNARPSFATNASDLLANLYQTPYGLLNAVPTAGERIIPINLGTGPSQFSLNLRVAKSFSFGRRPEANTANRPNGQGGPGGPGGGPPGGGRPGGGGGPGGGGFGGGGFGGPRGGFGGGGGNAGHRYTLTLSANVRNLFNNVDRANPNAVIGSPNFGKINALAGGFFGGTAYNRQISLQANFSF